MLSLSIAQPINLALVQSHTTPDWWHWYSHDLNQNDDCRFSYMEKIKSKSFVEFLSVEVLWPTNIRMVTYVSDFLFLKKE